MKEQRRRYCIEIARWDPARGQIAADIALRGGSPVPETSLLYGFRSPDYRDRVLAELRGCYGCDSALARELEPSDSARSSA